MESRSIGPLSVSAIGLGCNNFGRRLDEPDSTRVVRAALDAGITFFDTADRYGYGEHAYSGYGMSERFLGRALGRHREEVVIGTKFGMPMGDDDLATGGAGREWVRRACEDSLRRLGTDYIDLYQLHHPDPDTPIEETLEALSVLIVQGKVRAIGCSNFTVAGLHSSEECAAENGTSRFQSVQNEYSLLVRDPETDILPYCREADIAFIPYFPLASGLLTGKYRMGEAPPAGSRLSSWTPRPHFDPTPELMGRVERLIAFADGSGHSVLELALSWLLANSQVASVVAGATSEQQVLANVSSANWVLTDAEMAAIDEI